MRTTAGIVFILLIALTAMPATAPIHLSYVYSESMEPTINTGDGYIVVPADEIKTGDIIVFRSQTYDEYVTHRVVGHSEAGYITQGDNNPTSDQSAGHPHVTRSDVVGTVLTFHERPLIIPNLGSFVSAIREHLTVLLAGLTILGLIMSIRESGERPRQRHSLIRGDDIMHPMFIAGFLIVVCLILFGAGSTSLTYVAIDGSSTAQTVMTVGEPHTDYFEIPASTTPMSYQAIETSGMTVTNSIQNGSTTSLEVAIPAQSEIGPHRATLTVYQYPAVLPRGVVMALHTVHPILAATVTSGFSLTILYGIYVLFYDGQAPIRPSRNRWLNHLGGK